MSSPEEDWNEIVKKTKLTIKFFLTAIADIFFLLLIAIAGYLLYLLVGWIDLSFTEWLLFGIFIVLMFIFIVLMFIFLK